MISNGATIGEFLDVLANQLDRPVRDMTGLSGRYDITLDFAIDPSIMQAKMAAMGEGRRLREWLLRRTLRRIRAGRPRYFRR